MSAEDRQQCQDIACHLGGHQRCREAEIERGAERMMRVVRATGVTMAEAAAHWVAANSQRCREEVDRE